MRGARLADHLVHLVEDVQAAGARLLQRFAHDLRRDAHHLDVHLQRGNAAARAGDLEVHVAVVIFRARDVGEDGVLVAFLHQAHRDAGDRGLQRNARVHHAERCAADRRHRGRAIRLENVGDDAHGVRPICFAGQHGGKRALGQCAVADLATAGAAQERDFAHRERREVVVQHEALLGFAFEGLQPLHVFAGAERGGDQRLRLAAREDRGAVRARQHADLDPDIADLIELAAVGTAPLFDHLLAEDLLAQHVEVACRPSCGRLRLRRRNRLLQFVFELLDQRVAFVLGILLGVHRVDQARADLRAQIVEVILVDHGRLDHALRLAGLLHQLVDRGANLLDLRVAEFDGLDDAFFGPLSRRPRSSRCLRRCRPPSDSDRRSAARHTWD